MKFFTEIPTAFRVGIINASTTDRKIRRWIAVSLLFATALVCIGMSLWAFLEGQIAPGIIFMLHTITFTALTIAFIYTASTSEHTAQTRALLRGERRS